MNSSLDPTDLQALTSRLADDYQLGEPIDLSVLGDGPDNLVLRVSAGGEEVVARVSRRHGEQDVAFEHEAVAHLAQAGCPVPVLVSTRTGQTLTSTSAGPLTVYRYLPGAAAGAAITPDQADAAGEMLGMLHRAGASFSPRHQRSRDAWTELVRIQRLARRLEARWAGAAELTTAAQRLLHETHALDLPGSLCHGDFRPANVLFDGGAVSAVIDWDWCSCSPMTSDLALGMVEWSFRDGVPAPDVDLLAAVLGGYRKALPDVAAEALQTWVLASCVASAGTFFCDGLDTDLPVESVGESYMFQKYRYFRDNPQVVADLVGSTR